MFFGKLLKVPRKYKLLVMGRGWLTETVFIFCAVFMLIFLRPFGLNQENFLSSAIYWALICAIGFCVFSLTYWTGTKFLTKRDSVNFYGFIGLTLFAGIILTFLVPFFSSAYFGHPLTYTNSVLRVLPQMAVICSIIIFLSLTRNYIKKQNEKLRSTERKLKDGPTLPDFVTKLPRKLQGEVLCVKAEDHYINVHTVNGRFMLKMRFSDAMLQLNKFRGLRVHRSWWVSENAVLDAHKVGRKTSLVLKNDIHVPISTTNLKEVRKRGLL